MKWKIFSQKRRKPRWRLIFEPAGDTADIMALPGAIVEGRIAGRYLLASGAAPGTLIVQGVRRKGILAGADVAVDHDAAAAHEVDVAYQPRQGRASLLPAGMRSLEEMMLGAGDELESVPTEAEGLACLLYTSGTTGRPKGVRLTVKNFVCEQRATQDLLEIAEQDKIIGVLPFFHVFGLSNVLLAGLARGASIALVSQYSPGNLLNTIIERRPTLVLAIPTMYKHLLALLKRKRVRFPDSVRLCVSGAAPLPAEMISYFQEHSGARILEGYGLTETAAACCANSPGGVSKPGSIGRPLAGYRMKIVDGVGGELPQGEVGEIAIKGDGVTDGYYNLVKESEEAFQEGWFLTGDTGYMDEDGYFFITDRKKDIIIKGGFNISPAEVEDVLRRHDRVKEAAVIGRKRKEGEREEVVAFVTIRGKVASRELISHCRQFLSDFKVPDEIRFVETLPMSVTGKVLKKELKEGYQDDRRIERRHYRPDQDD